MFSEPSWQIYESGGVVPRMRSTRNFCKAMQTVLFKRTQSKTVYNLTFKLFKPIFTGLPGVFRVEECLKQIFWY